MNGVVAIPLVILGFLAAAVALAALIFLFAKLFGLTWKILGNIFRFIGAEIGDTLRIVGALLSALLFAPLVVLNIVIGRWSASRHFANAFWSEMNAAGRAVYRVFVGNPARLFGLGTALEGIEQRVPQAMAAAPGKDKPTKRVGQFDGYTIVGSLQGGGSGSRLYIAEPDALKRAAFSRQGLLDVDRVVIKVFSLKDGSSLPQIVRESRALDAAKKLGLVLEHELTPERFFYVMRYVPGDSLAVVTQRLHAESGGDGLEGRRLNAALGYGCDLLESLDAYHRAGLWHKDVKPDNIIVDAHDQKAHLVDFGLVTPLRSAMTLTTHGTEYFRDPELVRQALRGVKVHEIDGSRFDIYAAGAVLFSVIENSFPAHGGLSQTTKRCPEALRWIVRRAMTDYDRRYTSAAEMLADLRVVRDAADPFRLKPVDLPSVHGRGEVFQPEAAPEPFDAGVRPGPAHAARATPIPPSPRPAGRPNLTVADWWSGRYTVAGRPTPAAAKATPAPGVRRQPLVPPEARRSAADQVREARARARARRVSASERVAARRGARPSYTNSPSGGVVFAGFLGLAVFIALLLIAGGLFYSSTRSVSYSDGPQVRIPSPPALPAPPAPLPTITSRVLVVSELALPLSEADRQEVERGMAVLRNAGARLAGDLVSDSDDSVLDTLARLRHERGARPVDSAEMHDVVRAWVAARPEFDAVMFIAIDPAQSGRKIGVLITPEMIATQSWATAPERFVHGLASLPAAPSAPSTPASPSSGG